MKAIGLTLTTISGMLTACTTAARVAPTAQGDQVASACRPDAAAKLVGQPAHDNIQIKQRTGAELVRRIAPGDAVTHDFRANRVTLAIDTAGKVVQAACG